MKLAVAATTFWGEGDSWNTYAMSYGGDMQ